MMMAWYYAGYYTGFRDGQQQGLAAVQQEQGGAVASGATEAQTEP